ncbi:FMN-binding protein [Microbacter sp. GSS18]|nr:FMN-binding protein [Microbacter sp. GSS18]
MKKIIYSVLATLSGLVLLFSYKTSWNETAVDASAATISSDTTSSTAADSTSSSGDDEGSESSADDESAEDDGSTTSGSSGSASSSSSADSSSSLADGTYTGSAVSTRYGAVQVAITVSGGKITSVDVPQYPSRDGRDLQISQYSLPILADETVSAQSSSISMVSGATYTSRGYIESLQSAIDQAQQ